jgi:hypothetical protein
MLAPCQIQDRRDPPSNLLLKWLHSISKRYFYLMKHHYFASFPYRSPYHLDLQSILFLQQFMKFLLHSFKHHLDHSMKAISRILHHHDLTYLHFEFEFFRSIISTKTEILNHLNQHRRTKIHLVYF